MAATATAIAAGPGPGERTLFEETMMSDGRTVLLRSPEVPLRYVAPWTRSRAGSPGPTTMASRTRCTWPGHGSALQPARTLGSARHFLPLEGAPTYEERIDERNGIVSEMGKSHIVIMWTVGPDDVAEGDALFATHAKWMTAHTREGPTALRSYTISKGPELSDPLDPDSPETGNTIFVLDEFYESPAGPVEHWRLARSSDPTESWPEDLHALIPWSAKTKVSTLHSGTVVQDLW
jgi:hypothetical protein